MSYLQDYQIAVSLTRYLQSVDKLNSAYKDEGASAEKIAKLHNQLSEVLMDVPAQYRAQILATKDATEAQEKVAEIQKKLAQKSQQQLTAADMAKRLDEETGVMTGYGAFGSGSIFGEGRGGDFAKFSGDIFKNLNLEDLSKALFILSTVILFLVQKTNSIIDTLGVGTLIAIPSILPFNEGIISPIVFEAPVDVGTIDWLADLALLGSLWELSSILWSLVKAWIVVIKPFSISKFSFKTFATGAKQLVVQEAADIILSFLESTFSFTP